MTGRAIRNLYYITHLDNVPSILLHGILSHEEIQRRELDFTAIYDTDIVSRRSQISVPRLEVEVREAPERPAVRPARQRQCRAPKHHNLPRPRTGSVP
jgi:ssDNA thymidine ADP-ribosyltransferase, DarT